MARGKELSPTQRTLICDLKQAAKRGPNNTSLPRAGAPRKLTKEQCDRIYDVATNENPSTKIKYLLEEVGHTIEKRSMQNLLREMDLKRFVAK